MADPFHSVAGYTRFEALLEALPDPALLLDIDRTVIAANQVFRDTFTDGRDILGQPCHAVCHCHRAPCDGKEEVCPLDECLTQEGPVQALHVHRTAHGEALTALTMRALKGPAGEPDSVLEVLQPIDIASATPTGRLQLHGRSLAFRTMLREVRRIAPTRKPVLILGEPGTDKELVAEAIHDLGPYKDGSFVPVDCAALQHWQFERELFGQSPSPTASDDAPPAGLLGLARGGSLFLKDVDALDAMAQVRLLRLLETSRFLPETPSRQANDQFRLICSSTVDLGRAVEDGRFREDLRLLISSFPIQVPALRHRVGDMQVLVESALRRLTCQPRCAGVHADTIKRLEEYRFPGNLRELRSIVERACLSAEGDSILPQHLPREVLERPRLDRTPDGRLRFAGDVLPLSAAEHLYIEWARRTLQCSRAELAERLEISERTLYRRLSDAADRESS